MRSEQNLIFTTIRFNIPQRRTEIEINRSQMNAKNVCAPWKIKRGLGRKTRTIFQHAKRDIRDINGESLDRKSNEGIEFYFTVETTIIICQEHVPF